jgi:hypothetical protein
MVRVLMFAVFAMSFFLGACQKQDEKVSSDKVTPTEVQQKVTQAMDTAADYAKQEKDEYVAKAQKEMDDAKQDIERLKAKAKKASAKAKVGIDRDIKAAETKWTIAEQKLGELKAAGVESWKSMKAGVDKAVDDVKQFFARKKA